jgi:hypothetical protein
MDEHILILQHHVSTLYDRILSPPAVLLTWTPIYREQFFVQ